MIQPLRRTVSCQFAVFPQNGRQAQRFKAMIQKDFGGFGHAAFPGIKDM